MAVKKLTAEEFKKNIFNYALLKDWSYNGERPIVIDFYADWCGPCKMVAPIVEELAKEYEGKVDFYKVDTDKEAELAYVFGIRSIPTFVFIPKGGKQPLAQPGALPKEALKQIIEKELLSGSIILDI